MSLILCACAPSSASLQLEGVSVITEDTTEETTAGETTSDAVEEQETESGAVYVYVCGAVNNPGVYELSSDSRVYEALEMAGGITDDAAATALNLAERIYDGQQIYVPTWEEFQEGWTSSSAAEEAGDASALININTATKEELMTLTGIGETRAESIIAYREENGPFAAIEDLMLVSGIKEASFEKIKDYITVD